MSGRYICGPSAKESIPDCSFAEFFIPYMKSQSKGQISQVDATTGYEETCEEFLKRSLKASEGYQKLGLCQDDVFCLLARNSSDTYCAAVGVLWLGGVLAPLDTEWKSIELKVLFRKILPTAVICEVEVLDKVKDVLSATEIKAKIIVFAEKSAIRTEPYVSFEEILTEEVDVDQYKPRPVKSPATKTALILPTSGSTGVSKGVAITHRNVLFSVRALESTICKRYFRSVLVTSHFYWVSCIISLVMSLRFGTTRIYMRDINSDTSLKAIKKYKPEAAILAPIPFLNIARHPDAQISDFSCFKVFCLGGAKMTDSAVMIAKKLWGDNSPALNVYGATEVSTAICITEYGDDIRSSGKVIEGVKVRIVDVETGRVLGPHEVGLIEVFSPGLMKGYVGDEEETARVIKNGWYSTGDLGYYDEKEYLYVVDRYKELIKDSYNHQIIPTEIESVIESIPGVSEAGVTGLIKENDHIMLVAIVVPSKDSDVTQDIVKNYVKSNLADYKQPEHVLFVEKLPHTSTGKLRRKALKEMAESILA